MAPSNPYLHPAAALGDALHDEGELTANIATLLMHADQPDIRLNPNHPIAPDLQLSSTYRTPHPTSRLAADGEADIDYANPPGHIYSRYTSETRGRVERVLSGIMGANAITYASGLNAAYAIATYYQPTTIALRGGYFGCHESFKLYARTKANLTFIDLDAPYPESSPSEPLLVWLETPLNPSGEARDIAHYVNLTRRAGGTLAVDSTFAPPPLQNPFDQGADCVMHSGTKYFGGHSDLLMGVVAVKDSKAAAGLWHDRTYIGSAPGNLESYLMLRSLRTLSVRIKRQSETATLLASWLWTLCPLNTSMDTSALTQEDSHLRSSRIVGWVSHSSLQPRSSEEQDPESGKAAEGVGFDPRSQMPGGHTPTFAIRLNGPHNKGGNRAAWLPHLTSFWLPATSLGSVESLIEHRIAADPSEDPGTIRFSVGLEDVEDLKNDLRRGLQHVLNLEREKGGLVWQREGQWQKRQLEGNGGIEI